MKNSLRLNLLIYFLILMYPQFTLSAPQRITKGEENQVVNINPSSLPQSTANSTTSDFCPLIYLLGEDRSLQHLFREFRDSILARNQKGVNYIHLYYLNSPELTYIMLSHEDIRVDAKKTLHDLSPVLLALLQEGKAELTQQKLNEIDTLLNRIAHTSSSQLRELIKMAKSDMIKKEIFKELGITITDLSQKE